MDHEAIRLSAEGLGIILRDDPQEWLRQLTASVNEMLVNDFNRLVAILYRMDIPEKKLRARLLDHPDTDAAELIANMIIERQVQKIQSRQQFKTNEHGEIDEAERW